MVKKKHKVMTVGRNETINADVSCLAAELEDCRCEVFVRGKHTETDIVYMRPGLRDEIVRALRQVTESS